MSGISSNTKPHTLYLVAYKNSNKYAIKKIFWTAAVLSEPMVRFHTILSTLWGHFLEIIRLLCAGVEKVQQKA